MAAFIRPFLPEFGAEAEAIATIDKLFDVFNSSSAYNVKVERRAFGVTPEVESAQREVLLKGAQLIRGAEKVTPVQSGQPARKRRRTGPARKLPFQEGFLRNIRSVAGALEDARKFGLTYMS